MRNTILELWKTNKPCYVSKTLAKQKMKKCGTAKEISQLHTYLEQKGFINFGCGKLILSKYDSNLIIEYSKILDECNYNKNNKKELIRARMLKTQYNLKPPLLHGKNKSFKKVSYY